jgi:SAM-dependent methyltransferase
VTHPDNLATIAHLFGLSPPPIESARVLELGCAGAGNLAPMAANLPGTRFVGVDNSHRQIESGNRLLASLNLDNVTLHPMGIEEVTPELGEFDYIICYGVYSWVPEAIRDAVLRVCKQNLAPNGIAQVSYNIFPGWHEAGMLRDMLRYHCGAVEDPAGRVGKAWELLHLMRSLAETYDDTRRAFLIDEHDRLSRLSDAYLFYEYLEGENHPCYFHEFVAAAGRHGLQYVANARASTMAVENQPEEVASLLAQTTSLIQAQQWLDFLNNRRFRTSLLCHTGETVRMDLVNERLVDLYVRTDLVGDPDLSSEGPVEVEARGGWRATLDGRLFKATLDRLHKAAPGATAFRALVESVSDEEAHELAALVARLYFARVLHLHSYLPPVATTLAAKPTVSAVTRLLAMESEFAPNQWHQSRYFDASDRRIIAQLDGSSEFGEAAPDSPAAALLGELLKGGFLV